MDTCKGPMGVCLRQVSLYILYSNGGKVLVWIGRAAEKNLAECHPNAKGLFI